MKLKLTTRERQWIAEFIELMGKAPPSLGKKASAFTVGDRELTLYPMAVDKINEETDEDLARTLEHVGAETVLIPMPMAVHSVCG